MSQNALFAVGTLLTWVGWLVAFRALYLAGQLAFRVPGLNQKSATQGLIVSAVVAVVAIGAGMPMTANPASRSLTLPLVWFVLPFFAWLAIVAAIMVVTRLVQGFFALNKDEGNHRFYAAGVWLVVLFVGLFLDRRDPGNKHELLKGGIPLTFNLALSMLLIAVAGVVAMVSAAKWSAGRTVTQALTSQMALIAGSIVFGLPFAFLVITSFKEDRDMSSANGIVWVPRVQETTPFLDPRHPLYEGQYEGDTVAGTIADQTVDGKVRVAIEQPMSLRGRTFETDKTALKEVPRQAKLVTAKLHLPKSTGTPPDEESLKQLDGPAIKGRVIEDLEDGGQKVEVLEPANLKGTIQTYKPGETEPVRHVGLRWQNYTEALSFLPPETNNGLVYVKNTLLIVIFSVIGTILSSSIVAYAFSRMKFPGKDALFAVLLSTMMLPGAVTMLPQFLIFRQLGWIDTLYPLWVPAFFASAFNVFLLRQFFMQIPMELEDAAKIDGASYLKTFWTVMLPQVKPALAVIAIWTFMGAWNNFMGPLIYINSPENMPLSYALQLFQGDRSGEPGLLMAFVTMTVVPVLLLFFFAQRYFIEGVTLSGFGGR